MSCTHVGISRQINGQICRLRATVVRESGRLFNSLNCTDIKRLPVLFQIYNWF